MPIDYIVNLSFCCFFQKVRVISGNKDSHPTEISKANSVPQNKTEVSIEVTTQNSSEKDVSPKAYPSMMDKDDTIVRYRNVLVFAITAIFYLGVLSLVIFNQMRIHGRGVFN